jgi:hypothetical protein
MKLLRPSLLCAALLGFASIASSQVATNPPQASDVKVKEDPRITTTKVRYQYTQWAKALADYDGVRIADLQVPAFKVVTTEFDARLPIQQTLADADGVKRVAINWTIEATPKAARAELLGYLTAVNSVKDLPTTHKSGIEAGDVGFVGYSRDQRISWIAFSRGNITVRINCLDPRANPHPNMGKIAERVDQFIQLQPLLKDGQPMQAPSVNRFQTSRSVCNAGEWIELQLNASVAHVQWQVGGSGQAYVSKRDGKWMMRTTGPGSVKVHAEVWGKNTVMSKTATLSVSVRDDD